MTSYPVKIGNHFASLGCQFSSTWVFLWEILNRIDDLTSTSWRNCSHSPKVLRGKTKNAQKTCETTQPVMNVAPFEVLFGFAHLSSSTSLQHSAHMDLAVLLLGVSRSLGDVVAVVPKKTVLEGNGIGKWCFKDLSRWWFQIFFMFIPIWGNDPKVTGIFLRWVVETTN